MPMQAAAFMGGRISHSVIPVDNPSGAMAGPVLGGNVVGPVGLAGVGAAILGASVGSSSGGAPISLSALMPIMPHGAVTSGAPGLTLGPGGQAVPAIDPSSICALHAPMARQPVLPASQPTVMVNGKPLARVGDLTACGAFLCDGVPGVIVGGPKAPGPKISLGELGKSLGGAVLGAVLTQTGALERATALADSLIGAVDKVEKKAEAVVQAASDVVKKAEVAVKKAEDKAVSVVKKAETAVKKAEDTALSTVKKAEDAVKKAEDKVLSTVKKAEDTALSTVKKAEVKVLSTVQKAEDTALSTVKKAEDTALSAVESAAKLGEAVGSAASGMLGALLGGGSR